MRDPDLVQRAERAASALERAWDRWRTMHGLGSDPSPPVSSYVGYSMEQPWGQPRVVFGVDAAEAERLAALLDGHDCFGPVHAEVSGRPDWRRAPAGDPGASALSIDEYLRIPPQAPPPVADMITPVLSVDHAPALDGHVFEPGTADASVLDAADRLEVPAVDAAVSEAGLTEAYASPEPGEQAESVDEALAIRPQELAPLPPLPDPFPAGPMGSASLTPAKAGSNDVKPTPRPGYRGQRYPGALPRYKSTREPAKPPSAEPAEAEASSAESVPAGEASSAASAPAVKASGAESVPAGGTSSAESVPVGQASGAESVPAGGTSSAESVPVGQASSAESAPVGKVSGAVSAPAGKVSSAVSAPAGKVSSAVSAPASKPPRAKPRQVPKASRTRQQGSGVHEAREPADEQTAADHAV